MPWRPMRGTLEQDMWASISMISDARLRQPRDGQMKCGNQPADISMIHRRSQLPGRRVARPSVYS